MCKNTGEGKGGWHPTNITEQRSSARAQNLSEQQYTPNNYWGIRSINRTYTPRRSSHELQLSLMEPSSCLDTIIVTLTAASMIFSNFELHPPLLVLVEEDMKWFHVFRIRKEVQWKRLLKGSLEEMFVLSYLRVHVLPTPGVYSTLRVQRRIQKPQSRVIGSHSLSDFWNFVSEV